VTQISSESPFEKFHKVAAACEGYEIERLAVVHQNQSSALDLQLRWGPDRPDIMLSFQDVVYHQVGRFPELEGDPLDKIETVVLESSDQPWPAGLDIDMPRTSALPALLWFRAGGPVQLSIVAAIVTAYVEAR
jgi:hypothetical protein